MSEDLPDIDTVIDELYSLAPADFVSHRSAYVTRFKKAGDKSGATRIGGLRKPTVVAWLVNTLARQDESAVAELFDLGAELERAQQRGDGHRLRELSTARSASIRALTDRAVALGRERGMTVGDNAAREVSNTLNAAMADPEIRDRVRAGRTVVAETYSGFGPALLSLVPDPPETETEDDGEPDIADDAPESAAESDAENEAERLRQAEHDRLIAELDSAETAFDAARDAADAADQGTERAASERRSATAEVERLEAELEAARATAKAARAAERKSVEQAESAAEALETARARVTEARSALDEPS
ncbi:type IV secretory pathway VirB10-like protein [Rhodococcus cercidiphylli]|nr:type IV secretory pathway VirB10-like protein [Rhodococcus cercidiphylli]